MKRAGDCRPFFGGMLLHVSRCMIVDRAGILPFIELFRHIVWLSCRSVLGNIVGPGGGKLQNYCTNHC